MITNTPAIWTGLTFSLRSSDRSDDADYVTDREQRIGQREGPPGKYRQPEEGTTKNEDEATQHKRAGKELDGGRISGLEG